MERRLVVCVRWRPLPAVGSVAELDPRDAWPAALRTLVERATALGGRIVGWQEAGLSVDFALDGLQDAVDFLIDDSLGGSLSGGLAHGEVDTCLEGHRLALCTGEVLRTVSVLADCARPGEVLVSPDLVQATSGELLTMGAPKKREGREMVPALVLDVVHPLRSLLEEAVAKLLEPPWQHSEAPESCAPPPGQITVLRARAGGGGTRWLEELASGRDDVLWVRPGRAGFPGGALVDALGATFSDDATALEKKLKDGRWALLLVDDAQGVDADSLEILSRCCQEGSFGMVLRCSAAGSEAPEGSVALARVLSEQAVFAEFALDDLPPARASELAQAATGGRLNASQLAAIEALGTQSPLAVLEQVTQAFDSGNWVWTDAGVLQRSDDGLEQLSPEDSQSVRLARSSRRARRILEALAMLGGHVEARDAAFVLQGLLTSGSDAERELLGQEGAITAEEISRRLSQLAENRWLRQRPFRLASATLQRVLIRSMPAACRRAFHAGAARLGIQSGSVGGRVAAVVHLAQIGRVAQARDLAHSAMDLVRHAGFAATADAIAQFAEEGDIKSLCARGLLGGGLESVASAGEASMDWGLTPFPAAAQVAPRPSVVLAEEAHAPGGGEAVALADGAEQELLAANVASAALPAGEPGLPPPIVASSESDSVFPKQVADAIARRDPMPLLQMAEAMRERNELFAERLDALAGLVSGRGGEALGRLRRARERAQAQGLSEQCRAELSLSIALAAMGRPQEAFLQALRSLARAREGADTRGQRASALFLARLADTLGHSEEAKQWSALAG